MIRSHTKTDWEMGQDRGCMLTSGGCSRSSASVCLSSSSRGSGLVTGGCCHTMASWACSLRYRLVRCVRLTRLTTFPRLPALEVRRRSRERWRPWARRSASCLCFSSSSLALTSSSPHTSRGVSSTRDFPFRSAPCATSNFTRCTCRQPAVAAWLRALARARNRPSPCSRARTHLAPVSCSM